MINEHDRVVLLSDLPGAALTAGDVGTVIHVHDGGAAFVVEFLTLDGETVAIETVEPAAIRPVRAREVAHARSLKAA
jgi:hypothetical protein